MPSRTPGFLSTIAALAVATSATLCIAAPPQTMKAVRVHQWGGAEVLRYEDAPTPVAGKGQVLIKVLAAGVNPVDWKIRDGMISAQMSLDEPLTLGLDVSGIVEAIGPGATKFAVGDEVYAFLPIFGGGGYAQYSAVPEAAVALKPKSIDHIHAAGVPLAALTAWQALVDTAKIKEGQTVLIHAGAGGVGHFAIQIAKAKGAHVITTASPRNHEYLKSIGADEVIDYHATNFENVVHDVDIVLDAVGGDTLERSYQVIKPGGLLITIAGQPNPIRASDHNIRVQFVLVHPDGEQLTQLADLIDAGKIIPHVSATLPLSEVAKAHAKSGAGHTRGKIVLTVE